MTINANISRARALDSVGKGWARIINNLYDAKPKGVSVIQVKEKYGTLRFYVGSAPEWFFDLIDYYEEQSGEICENCGAKGTTVSLRGWLKTVCDECYKKWMSGERV